MPQLGETVTEGTITRWLKQPGDAVAVDDALFEVSTDKVDTEVPSAHAGVLRQILVPEGETVPIGTPLAVITESADDPVEVAASPEPPPPMPEPEVRQTDPPMRVPAPQCAAPGGENGFLPPGVRALVAERGRARGDVVGRGRDGGTPGADVLAAAATGRGAGAAPAPAAAGAAPNAVAYPPAQPGDDD